ncbi:MAG: copper resistance protein NlpE N-terminal domain-containing protein [Bacteroidetes bacterium]|nr:copper resistance protein NlpE N-terminal domain-containing protein [Bacteroidota bacterium]
MKASYLGITLIFSILFISCDRNTRNATVTVDTVATDFFQSLDASAVKITYEGTLPCADCEGILTTLSITPDSSLFTLTEVYKGKIEGDTIFERSGKFNKISGSDSSYTYLEFIFNNNSEKQLYRQSGDTTISKLDQFGNVIPSSLNYTLRRI